ncbi:MAG TPA: beta-ketoacyl-ACP synthase II [Candidatus Limnocylindrales bacterium]|nr:beta-ketoacyl-ACP synthase II [Candidatus Limnocylindrales bacterium]
MGERAEASSRRVVVTGMGLVSPVGNDVATSWEAMLAGESGGGPVTAFDATDDFPCRIGCEVKGFDPLEYMEKRDAKRFDRVSHFGLAASAQALRDAGFGDGIGSIDPERFGVVFGSGIGGIATFEEQHRKLIESGPGRVSPFFVPMFIPDISAGLVSIRWGLRGPNYATVSACASSAHAIGEGMRHIMHGDADLILAGGAEATITPMTYAGFSAMKAMSTRNDDPAGASRPFSADRDGFVMGEGGGALVLEELDHARARGATILAEVAGYGLSGDAFHITAPPPGGYGAQHAMRMALERASADPTDVDYVNAHGTSTMADAVETAAVKAVLGDHAYEIVMGSTKSMTGHLLGAAGALEAIASIQVCRTGKIPPTINFQGPDPECDLEYAHGGMLERPVKLALTNSFGFGGHNVCLALRRWD